MWNKYGCDEKILSIIDSTLSRHLDGKTKIDITVSFNKRKKGFQEHRTTTLDLCSNYTQN